MILQQIHNLFFQGITVREGDSNLITRLESPKLGKMEMIREFSKDGMVLVRAKIFLKQIFKTQRIDQIFYFQYIKILDRDFEAIRHYKKVT